MADVRALNRFLQEQLDSRGVSCVTPVEAGQWLVAAGLLRDSPSRPGKPLRDLLRAGAIVGSTQASNSRWSICRSRDTTEPTRPGFRPEDRQQHKGQRTLLRLRAT